MKIFLDSDVLLDYLIARKTLKIVFKILVLQIPVWKF